MNNYFLVALALSLSACFPQLPKVPDIEVPDIQVPEASELTKEILSPIEKTIPTYP